ncbi:hypothetical protein BJY01DRAFT_245711 [Aspergillus pseudoustus]|uniref:Signal recognition particle-docking protein FtsY n=1 Tax=Aspergillus pseudoustus TaxID=1810923 RepID=A0ABR4KFA5_9EURO
MTFWNKVKTFFGASKRIRNNGLSEFKSEKETHHNLSNHDSEDGQDPWDALSEVAAPEPVQRLSPEEQARRPSLEQRLSDMSNSGHDREDDIYENLSELAAPEPIEKLSESEMARRPSLEQSLSRSH